MPAEKMIIMAEGQGPIFADKLRFFRTAPFKAMEHFSRANVPDVPATEFLPKRPVPAIAASTPSVRAQAASNVVEPPSTRNAPIVFRPERPNASETGDNRSSAPDLDPVAAALGDRRSHFPGQAKVPTDATSRSRSPGLGHVVATSIWKSTGPTSAVLTLRRANIFPCSSKTSTSDSTPQPGG